MESGTVVPIAGAERRPGVRLGAKRASVLSWLVLGAAAGAAIAGCSSNSRNGDAPSPPAIARASANAGFTADMRVRDIVADSCFDCHSQQGASSWAVVMAPSYWFGGSARRNLNFSEWDDYDAQRKAAAIAAIGRTVTRGEMPPWDYTVFHPAAELSNAQKDIVSDWAMRESAAIAAH